MARLRRQGAGNRRMDPRLKMSRMTERGRGLRDFGPARRGPFVSAKGPKTIGARTWPQGDAFAPVPTVRAAELASLRQSSPPDRFRDWGVATPAGAGKSALRHVPGFDQGWRGYEGEDKDAGSPIRSGMTERGKGERELYPSFTQSVPRWHRGGSDGIRMCMGRGPRG